MGARLGKLRPSDRRRAAARKGWETRRHNQRAAERRLRREERERLAKADRERERRSQAARKGWETRRRATKGKARRVRRRAPGGAPGGPGVDVGGGAGGLGVEGPGVSAPVEPRTIETLDAYFASLDEGADYGYDDYGSSDEDADTGEAAD